MVDTLQRGQPLVPHVPIRQVAAGFPSIYLRCARKLLLASWRRHGPIGGHARPRTPCGLRRRDGQAARRAGGCRVMSPPIRCARPAPRSFLNEHVGRVAAGKGSIDGHEPAAGSMGGRIPQAVLEANLKWYVRGAVSTRAAQPAGRRGPTRRTTPPGRTTFPIPRNRHAVFRNVVHLVSQVSPF